MTRKTVGREHHCASLDRRKVKPLAALALDGTLSRTPGARRAPGVRAVLHTWVGTFSPGSPREEARVYQQVLDPVGGSLAASALVAMIPLATLFVLLGGLKLKAHVAGFAALLVAMLVAILAYGMPVDTTLAVATEGAAFGLFPIIWIIWNAIWIYNMTVETGHFAVLRRSFATISDDQRIQAIIIAFCFGALLEALAGFGTPVAITAVMLIAVGFKPIKAAAIALVANTAPVAFGAIATPIVTLAELTGIPQEDLGAMVGRQTPLLALFVPLILVGMVDGWRGVRRSGPRRSSAASRSRSASSSRRTTSRSS